MMAEDHRRHQARGARHGSSDHFGLWPQKVLPHWAEPLWANTLRENGGGGEEKRRRKAGGEGESKWRRKREGGEEQRKRGQSSMASRTICPGWPRREVGRSLRGAELVQQGETRKRNRGKQESEVKENIVKRDEKGKTITN